MLLGGLQRRRQGVPFEGDGEGEVGLGQGQSNDFFGLRVPQRPCIEVDLESACLFRRGH